MRLIDRVLAFDGKGETIVCSAQPRQGSPFLKNGVIPGIVCLEYMAQTVAAYVTLRRVTQASAEIVKPRVGFIISARDLKLGVEHLQTDQRITISAKLVWSDSTTASFDCSLQVDSRVAASTRLTVYEPPDARADT